MSNTTKTKKQVKKVSKADLNIQAARKDISQASVNTLASNKVKQYTQLGNIADQYLTSKGIDLANVSTETLKDIVSTIKLLSPSGLKDIATAKGLFIGLFLNASEGSSVEVITICNASIDIRVLHKLRKCKPSKNALVFSEGIAIDLLSKLYTCLTVKTITKADYELLSDDLKANVICDQFNLSEALKSAKLLKGESGNSDKKLNYYTQKHDAFVKLFSNINARADALAKCKKNDVNIFNMLEQCLDDAKAFLKKSNDASNAINKAVTSTKEALKLDKVRKDAKQATLESMKPKAKKQPSKQALTPAKA